jgi:uncharacterized membrane protein (UPF0127 family)
MGTTARVVAVALVAVAVALCSRQRPVEEPSAAPPHDGDRSSAATASTAAADGPEQPAVDPRLRGRCIRTRAAAPPRPAAAGLDPRCPDDPDPKRPALERGQVVFPAAGVTLEVELARRDQDRMRGLMFRRTLSDEQGMLFLFETRQDQRFWMRNTCLPLDMLFIDRDGLIVGIEENVPTLNDHSYRVGCPSVYVLEVPAGWAQRHGVDPGHFVRLRLAQ